MELPFVRLNGCMNAKEGDKKHFRPNAEVVQVWSSIKHHKEGYSVDEVQASKEPELVLVATLEAVDEGHEFVDADQFESLVDDPVLTESTEGEELEGERIE